MRTVLFILLTVAGTVISHATVPAMTSGTIYDSETAETIRGAIIQAISAEGKVTAFTSSDEKGVFSMKIPAQTKALRIRCMGYESKNLDLPLAEHDIYLTATVTRLKEVTVNAPDIFQKGDTLVFSVDKFANAQDNAIIDVIKRLPGVRVEEDGTIKYNGKPINKFYIEGNDFAGDLYSVAANNISKEDVSSVEVLENHQPIKALEDIEFSDQAAINLKLKEDARDRWAGVMTAGAGCSPMLYSGSAFAMRMARQMQNMFTMKADNNSWNPANEITDRSYDPMFSNGYAMTVWPDYITADHISQPLSERRTRDNSSWLGNAISAWGKGDASMRLTLNYAGDRVDSRNTINTDYMSDKIDDYFCDTRMHSRNHDVSVRFKTEINKREYFMKDIFTARFISAESRSDISGNNNVKQYVHRKNLYINNDARIMRKSGKRFFTISSRNTLSHMPSRLDVFDTESSPVQNVNSTDLRSTTELSIGRTRGFWNFSAEGNIDIEYRRMRADLTHFKIEEMNAESMYNIFTTSASLCPKAIYERGLWRVVTALPVKWHHYHIRSNYDFASFSPSVWIRRQLGARSEIIASAQYSQNAPAAYVFTDFTFMNDYRNLFRTTATHHTTETTNVTATYRYRDPLNALFANGNVGLQTSRSPLIQNQVFTEEFILTTYRRLPNETRTITANGGVSKGLGHGRIVAGIDASWSLTSAAAMRDEAKENYNTGNLTVKPFIKGSLTKWLSAAYDINYTASHMRIGNTLKTNMSALNQTLNITVIPDDFWQFTASAEHFYNRLTDASDANIVFIDMSATWKPRHNIRISISATNLLDKRKYSYTTFGTLSQSEHSYAINPRTVMASMQIRF